jgi:hypothetical protein
MGVREVITKQRTASLALGNVDGFPLVGYVALLYVTAPAFLFFFCWVSFVPGVVAALAYGYVLMRIHLDIERGRSPYSITGLLVVAAFSLSWVALSGAGHYFYANAFDWVPRFAMARDLAEFAWPVSYKTNGAEYLLRAALGYYLVPAGLAKLVDITCLDALIYGWTAIGVFLVFLIAFPGWSVPRLIGGMLIFGLASGFDVIGYQLRNEMWPELGEHIEIWTSYLEYPSNTTQLFWAPNHSIAAWIATALLLRFQDNRVVQLRLIPALLPSLLLWSPLSAAGFTILWGSIVVTRHLMGLKTSDLVAVVPILVPVVVVLVYLCAGIATIPAPHNSHGFFRSVDRKLLLFIAMEGVFPALLVLWFRVSVPTLVASLSLVVLPFFQFGGANDLVMRTSIPAMTVLWLTLADQLTDRATGMERGWVRMFIALTIWLVGSVTSMQEISRAVLMPNWKPDLAMHLPDAFSRITPSEPFPPHYFLKLTAGTLVQKVLKNGSVIPELMCKNVKPLYFNWAISIPPKKKQDPS